MRLELAEALQIDLERWNLPKSGENCAQKTFRGHLDSERVKLTVICTAAIATLPRTSFPDNNFASCLFCKFVYTKFTSPIRLFFLFPPPPFIRKVAIWASRGQKSISLGLKQKWHQTIPCEAHCLSWKFETIWASGFGVMSAFLRAKLKPWCGHLPAHCQKVIDPFPELPRPRSLQGLVRFSRNFLLLIHKI